MLVARGVHPLVGRHRQAGHLLTRRIKLKNLAEKCGRLSFNRFVRYNTKQHRPLVVPFLTQKSLMPDKNNCVFTHFSSQQCGAEPAFYFRLATLFTAYRTWKPQFCETMSFFVTARRSDVDPDGSAWRKRVRSLGSPQPPSLISYHWTRQLTVTTTSVCTVE